MNNNRLLELYWEFDKFRKDLLSFYLDAIFGFSLMHKYVCQQQKSLKQIIQDAEESSIEFQDQGLFSYSEIFLQSLSKPNLYPITQGEVKDRNLCNGGNMNILGRVCITVMYDYWEEYLRVEWGMAKGVLPSDFQKRSEEKRNALLSDNMSDDFWGDVRLLRNAIVHHRGIANKDLAKCKLMHWFKEGDEINIPLDGMDQIFSELLRTQNKIHADSLN